MRNFPEQFSSVVDRFSERPAVSVRREGGVERVTYRELAALARGEAAWLLTAGLGRADRCALLSENSARWCAAYLGILQVGAIAVPLDTNYHQDQITKLLRDSGARVLLVSPRFEAVARAAAQEVGCTLGVLPLGGAPASPPAICPCDPSDSAVILYTSGTTADPKGVVLTHANLLAEKDGAFQVVPVDEHDAVLGVLPLFHSLAQMANLLLPFSLGAHVVFLETLNTRELLRALDEEGITVFACVPQFFYLIHARVLEEVKRGGAMTRAAFRVLVRVNRALRAIGFNLGRILFGRVHRTLGARMRLLITGGSKFDPAIGHDLHDLGFTILQAYGLTETSGAAAITRPGEPIETVGRPLPGTDVRIQPPDTGHRTPDTDGEILIRGPIVMKGYWNRPDATGAVLKDGWLYTGDLGRLDAQGRLQITGRSKEMIVLGSGKNIYPEEIEAHYRQSPFIKELCVLGVTDPGAPTSERLHAVVVPDLDVLRDKRIVNTSELIRFELEGLSVSLPPHKRVLGFDVTLEPLPRTTTGKLKRHELQRQQFGPVVGSGLSRTGISAAGFSGPESAPPPATDVEPHVARVVAAVREHVRAGAVVRPESNLELDLGLDSMERVELLASLEQRFGVRVPEAIAQSAFLVRDLADAFRDVSGSRPAGEALPWSAILGEEAELDAAVRELLRQRPAAAFTLFVALRALVRLLCAPGVRGLERLPSSGPYIISPNHQSYVDPMVIAGVLPFGVFRRLFSVGAAEYFQTPLTRWLAAQLNVVPVDPDAYLVPAMQAAAFGLRHGRVLVLFPEGERSIDGRVKKFKKGAAILSQHLDVPIVPVAIDGLFEIWPRNRPLAWRRLLPWSRHRVTIHVGEPLAPIAGESYAEQAMRLRGAVEEMWLEAHRDGPQRRRDAEAGKGDNA